MNDRELGAPPTAAFANATLILPDAVVPGAVRIRDGVIAAVDRNEPTPRAPNAADQPVIDCGGDYLAPGLIELHTDNLERHLEPRPQVHWPHLAAILSHDAELAANGVTTVFDSLRLGVIPDGRDQELRYARAVSREMWDLRAAGALRISHFLHLRAEICSETLIEELAEFGPEDRVGIVSLMDHTPGQRQFRDLAKLRTYLKGKRGMSDADVVDHFAKLAELRARLGARNEAQAVAEAKRYGAALASHDDTTEAHVEVSASYGVRLTEFPTTVEAAAASRARAMAVIMGAPNLVRGGSHSGNVATEDLAERGLVDILSSDYAPSSLLLGAVMLGRIWSDLARGLATVTATPARYAQLSDRGALEVGKRADLVRFRLHGAQPVVVETWSAGRRVA